MERIFTQEELEIINQAEQLLKLRGVITEEGNPSALHNLKLLITPFDKNPSSPVTVDGLISVANRLADKLHYTSKAAKQLASSQLTAAEMDNVQDFLHRKPLVRLDGTTEGGFHNAVLLVEWLRRYRFAIDFNGLQKAMEGFAYSQSTDPKQLLRWLESTTGSKHYGKHSADDDPNRKPGQLFSEEQTSRLYVNGRKNHSLDPEFQKKPAAPTLDASESSWKQMADAKLGSGGSHSGNAALQEAYDNALVTTSSYRQVFEAVSKVAKRLQVVRG
jgi:hypothetical protein